MPQWFLNDLEDLPIPKISLWSPQIFNLFYPLGNILLYLIVRSFKLLRFEWNDHFGDGMIGPKEYDYLGPALFLCEGKAELLTSLFSGYGVKLDENQNVMTTLFILHRYSWFDFQIKIDGWREKVSTINDLAELIFPI